MAVAHSAASESHAGTTGSTAQTAFSWTHTQTGTPRGVLVFVHVANSAGNPVSSVTYGGVTLERVSGGAAIDSAGEAGRTDLFFAGSGLGTGNQTITVNRANTANIMYASAATVTALTDTNVTGIVLLQGDGALTVQSVTDGGAPTNSLRYAAAYSGLAAPPPAGTGSTLLNSIDFGNYGIALVRETTAGTGARNVGFNNATTDDRAAVHVAVRELWNRTDTETVGAFTLTGNDATLTKAAAPKVMDGGTGAFTLTGQPADLLHNANVDGGTGAFALTGQPADLKIGHAIAGDVGKFFLPERNLARYSEQFDNAYWIKNGIGTALAPVVTANAAVAPDGTLTADRVVFDTNGSTTTNDRSDLETSISTSSVTGKTYIFSVWLKTTDGSSITIQLSHSAASPTYPTVTGTWQRFTSLSNVAADANRRPRLSLRVGTPTSAYASLHVWGFQWEEGTSITDYDPTGPANATDAALRQAYRLDGGTGAFTLAGQPADTRHNVRIEGGTGAFSLAGNDATLTKAAASKVLTANTGTFTLAGNPASTLVAVQLGGDVGKFFLPERNQRQWSEEFNNAYWTKINASITANATTAPDGTLTADALIENATSSVGHQVVRDITYVTGKTYTHSCYFKLYPGPITRYVRLQLGTTTVFGSDVYANINLTTGVVTNTPGLGATTSVTNVGNGWYRASISLLYTGSGTTAGANITLISSATGSALYTDADGLSGVYVWGVQWEESASVTDYDPTGPAGATDTALRQQYKLTAEVGAFTLTGNSATLAKGRTFTAETGTFTATGQPATLRHNSRIEASTGSFALSGGAPVLVRGRYLSGGSGTFTETGQPATFRRTWAIQGGTGSFALTGNPAALTELGAYEIDPIVGAFALTGQAANLAHGQKLQITVGVFNLTGQPATLKQNQQITAGVGAFNLTGQPATLKQNYLINATVGSFSLLGNPATLTKQSALQINAQIGVFNFVGNQAGLAQSRSVDVQVGIFNTTGNSVNLQFNRKTYPVVGIFTVTGNDATLTFGVVNKTLEPATGSFIFAGNPATLQINTPFSAQNGAFLLSGKPVNFSYEQRRRVVFIF